MLSIMFYTSYCLLTNKVVNIHISTNNLFKEIKVFSIMLLKTLSASTYYPIAKPLPHF